MFPESFIENTSIENNEEAGIDFLFDYETGQHIMQNSVLKECDKLQSIKQYIQNVLRTQVNLYKVYTKGEENSFGIDIYNYIGQRSLPMGYLNSELKREVTENLLKHSNISAVSNWVGKREKQGLSFSFDVTLDDGSIISESEYVSTYGAVN